MKGVMNLKLIRSSKKYYIKEYCVMTNEERIAKIQETFLPLEGQVMENLKTIMEMEKPEEKAFQDIYLWEVVTKGTAYRATAVKNGEKFNRPTFVEKMALFKYLMKESRTRMESALADFLTDMETTADANIGEVDRKMTDAMAITQAINVVEWHIVTNPIGFNDYEYIMNMDTLSPRDKILRMMNLSLEVVRPKDLRTACINLYAKCYYEITKIVDSYREKNTLSPFIEIYRDEVMFDTEKLAMCANIVTMCRNVFRENFGDDPFAQNDIGVAKNQKETKHVTTPAESWDVCTMPEDIEAIAADNLGSGTIGKDNLEIPKDYKATVSFDGIRSMKES